ncbi:MAG: exonuclease SbcCD subunit D C-terminal domain-containing protein [Planctomycetes bacterium]|nr:exonuclease SbcCD subunit D C-terminal domain-containing protein [Planctomycetota bacterium]
MRLIHTADWHLGHVLHDHPRTFEHERFLAWLLDLVESERADALVVAGDVFDVANPPTSALDAWFGFLASSRARFPRLELVVVGGNHDSPSRLDVTNPLLAAFRIHVVGGLPRRPDRSLDLDRLVVPLEADGRRAAWCVAMPFLRPSDLPVVAPAADPLVEGVRAVYAEALEAVRARRRAGEPVVALGHCYMTGTRLSELSERRILGGNQHALPVDVFPDDLAYAALGHLHLAQAVGGRETVRYSGSPIPLSFSETDYRHQVCVVDLTPDSTRVRSVPVPRAVPLLRLPEGGAAPLPDVRERLRALPALDGPESDPRRPLLEVRVRCDRPEPNLRREVEEALAGRAPRLLRIGVELPGDARALAEAAPGATLRDLSPEHVLRLRWARDHEGEPPAELLAAFSELVESVSRGEAP